MNTIVDIERHPLQPFLPSNAKVLFLGSFPPPRKRWSMEFFYPNWINDHWRIEGEIWFGDKNYFLDIPNKCFKVDIIKSFCAKKGLAFFDTAQAVRRLKDNASDAYLEVVEQTDIRVLLECLPHCRVIVTTGEKATETICRFFGLDIFPRLDECIDIGYNNVKLYRLPSSSRAYPLAFERKVEAYRVMFECFMKFEENDELS